MSDAVRKTKRGTDTIQRIIEAAAALFADEGYDSVPVRRIAQAVDIKESSLYNHFSGKEAMLDVLLDGFAKRVPASRPSMGEILALMDVLTPAEVLKTTILRVGQGLTVLDNNVARIIYSEMYRNERATRIYRDVMVEDALSFYASVLGAMMDKGLLVRGDAAAAAEVLYTSILASTIEYAMARGDAQAMASAARRMMRTVDFMVGLMKPVE